MINNNQTDVTYGWSPNFKLAVGVLFGSGIAIIELKSEAKKTSIEQLEDFFMGVNNFFNSKVKSPLDLETATTPVKKLPTIITSSSSPSRKSTVGKNFSPPTKTFLILKYASYALLASKVAYDVYSIYNAETAEESYDAAMSLSYTAGSYAFGVMFPEIALSVQAILLFDSLVTREYTKAMGEYMADAMGGSVQSAEYDNEAMPSVSGTTTDTNVEL